MSFLSRYRKNPFFTKVRFPLLIEVLGIGVLLYVFLKIDITDSDYSYLEEVIVPLSITGEVTDKYQIKMEHGAWGVTIVGADTVVKDFFFGGPYSPSSPMEYVDFGDSVFIKKGSGDILIKKPNGEIKRFVHEHSAN